MVQQDLRSPGFGGTLNLASACDDWCPDIASESASTVKLPYLHTPLPTLSALVLGACTWAAAAQPANAPALDPALATAAAEKGAVVTASGLVHTMLKAGTGAQPSATDTVSVHYRGTFPDGREFDSSYSRGQPTSFPLNRVIPCWTEGLQLMKVGGKSRLTCPAAIAYGTRGAGSVIPPNAVLQFEVELLAVQPKAP
jgi:FKBP-type peptidyl-prolyl cis-trans isomerase FkpA